MLRKIWRKLPESFRKAIDPVVLKLWSIVCSIFAMQNLRHPIGKVRVPFLAKPYLKRSVAQQGEDLVLDRIITRVLGWDVTEPRVYVDIGAYHPIDHSVTYLLYRRGWRGVVFDPSSATMKAFGAWRKEDEFVQAVVGEKDGVDVDFYLPNGGTDMSLTNTKYPSDEGNYRVERCRQVSISEELIRRNIASVDVLSIDVEGAELEILRTFDFEKFAPSVIAIEIHGNDIQKCLQTEEAKIILSHGYRAVGCAVITFFFVKESEIPV